MRWLIALVTFFITAQDINAREIERPVLLVPGMGGSILRSADGDYDGISLKTAISSLPNELTNGHLFADPADNMYRKYMLLKYRSDGRCLPVFTRQPLLPPYALDPAGAAPETLCLYNFEPGGLCGIEYPVDLHYSGTESVADLITEHYFNHSALNNYAQLVKFLKGFGYVPEQSLFGFSYDWRQSNRNAETMQRLDATLEKIYRRNNQKKVSVFSHSLGCMVVKLYIALYPENAKKYIGQWIAAGAPFQGTAGYLLSSLISGYALGDNEICGCTARALMVQIPSVLEMMPSSWYEKNIGPAIVTASWRGGHKQFTGHQQIATLLDEAYKTHTFRYDDQTVHWPFSTSAFAWSLGTREILDKADPVDDIEHYVVYGVKSKTAFSPVYKVSGQNFEASELLCLKNGCQQNRCISCTAECQPAWDFIDGDGIAPAQSASTPYARREPARLVKYEVPGVSHRELIDNNGEIYAHFQEWLGLTADDLIPAQRANHNPSKSAWNWLVDKLPGFFYAH